MLAADLQVLAHNESLGKYLEDPAEDLLDQLTLRFLNFSKDRKVYLQTRYLDKNGIEVVRINRNNDSSYIVEAGDLQDKSTRYYFKDTMVLEKGGVFVSPLDLNVENGEIETPLLPVLRVAAPVFDEKGVKQGMVLLNYKASMVLNRYFELFPYDKNTNFTFLNKDSYWLKAEAQNKEWGFMLTNNRNLKNDKPELWADIQKFKMGQYNARDGLYTYSTIYPEKEINSKNDVNVNRNRQDGESLLAWHLLLNTSSEKLSFWFFLKQYVRLIWLVPVIGSALAAAMLYIAYVRANKEKTDRSLTMLSTSIEQSPAAIVITKTDGFIQYANPKFERMTGFSRNEIYGQNPRIFKSGTTSESVYSELWQTVMAGKVWEGDFENARKDDTPYYVSAKISPVFNKAGTIECLMAVQEDVTVTRKLQFELERIASIDSLTGAYNRNRFLELFAKEASRTSRYGHQLAVFAFDLDNFKAVNDTYGHHMGDEVLRGFVNVVESALRGSDIFGRIGGEEFCAILVQTDRHDAMLLAERLRRSVEQHIVTCDKQSVQVTVSIGVTVWLREDREIEDAIKRADRALYEAKDAGRNCVKFLPSD